MKFTWWMVVLLLSVQLANAEKKKPTFERAKVVSQDVNSSQAGTYAAPIGNATIAVPIYRTSNRVVVETDTQILEWSEAGSPVIILPVNGFVEFYRDGDWYVVLDAKKKKHKFAIIGIKTKEQPK